jgi:tetratricopeptide (TPR) repeat protein
MAYRDNHLDDAIRWCEKAVDMSPDSASMHLWLARAIVKQIPGAGFIRQPILVRRARAQFDRAVELDPANVSVREDRAIFYMYSPAIVGGGADKARAEAEIARTLDPYRGAIVRAEIEEHNKNLKAAEAEYVALVKSYPDSATPFNLLITAYQAAREFTSAFAAIDARSAAAPRDPWATYQLGKTAALSGERLESGEAALRRYLRDGQFLPSATEANAHYRLGMILEQRRDAPGARAEYEAATRLDPKLQDARRALERLRP